MRETDITTLDGLTLYQTVRNSLGQYWTGTVFENRNASNWSEYAESLTKSVISANVQANYSANFPSLPAGTYRVDVYVQSGGSPAITDGAPRWSGQVFWNGNTDTGAADTHYAGPSRSGFGVPGQVYYALLDVSVLTGQLLAADSTPTATVWHNNAIDGTVSIASSTTSLPNVYAYSFTYPAYTAYDQVELRAAFNFKGQAYGYGFEKIITLVPTSSLPVSSAGLGAYGVTVKVTSDGTTPVAGATVRLTATGQTYVATSDVTGNANFSVNAGSFVISATLTGYGFAPVTLAVDGSGHWPNGTATETITLAPVVIPAATNPGQTNAWAYCFDGSGNVVPNLTVNFRLFDPSATANAFTRATMPVVSSSIGLIQIPLILGGRYEYQVAGDAQWTRLQVPSTGSTFQLPELLGVKF